MAGFVEVDGRRFEFGQAALELYHCESGEPDWNLELVRAAAVAGQQIWLASTVIANRSRLQEAAGSGRAGNAKPTRASDLYGMEFRIEGRDLDGMFEQLLGVAITTYPNGQDVCSASFVASPGSTDDALELVAAFEFDWDRYLDPPGASYPEPRAARLEFVATLVGLHANDLPG
ncbi:hypothetical protein DB30_06146 [Enhygromyxa salina]|uniref:Uncharacterized protein n=1 Tax=Enhygromyxa salina TaxID=215803 RepID=A0A0C2D4D6_9BACT|nr:hypothetical protein [Enhygromyxa salina]KIG14957.1 hypothetical protein DB30_06146 [Enhygromyxa salina]